VLDLLFEKQRTGSRSFAPQVRARGTSRVFAHPAVADQSTGGLDRRSTPLHGENNGCEEEEGREEGGEEEEVARCCRKQESRRSAPAFLFS
jgi:hypothetical protein